MIADFVFSLSITLPIFSILVLGVLFKRLGWVTEEFARLGSDLVFRVTLPCLLFVKLVQTDFRHHLPVALIGYALAAVLVLFLLLDRLVAPLFPVAGDRGVFVQGAFRGNLGIIGLAFCLSAFGESVVSIASIYLAIMTTLFNILAVVTLSRHGDAARTGGLRRTLVNVRRNPLILAIAVGVLVSLSGFQVPAILLKTGGYFAQMTLPLALLCAGASIRPAEFQSSLPLYAASFSKLVAVPVLITAGGILFGLRGPSLGVLFLMNASPAAAASYPMAQAMNGNHHLAAAIIAATSLGSLVTTTLGIFLLRSCGLL